MNYKKPFIVCLCAAVLSFIGFIASMTVCWILGAGIELYIFFAVFFTALTIIFFLSFCYFDEKLKRSPCGAKEEKNINNTKINVLIHRLTSFKKDIA